MQAPGRICNKIVIFAEEASVHETIRAAEQAEQEKPESAPRRPAGNLVRLSPVTRVTPDRKKYDRNRMKREGRRSFAADV